MPKRLHSSTANDLCGAESCAVKEHKKMDQRSSQPSKRQFNYVLFSIYLCLKILVTVSTIYALSQIKGTQEANPFMNNMINAFGAYSVIWPKIMFVLLLVSQYTLCLKTIFLENMKICF